jgi:hypothetical protein
MLHETLCCNPSTVSLWLLRPTWPPYRGLCCVFFSSYFFDFYTYTYFISFQKCFGEGKGKKNREKKSHLHIHALDHAIWLMRDDLTWRWIYVSKIIAIFYSWSLEFIACFPFLNLLSNYNCKYVCFCIALLRIILSTTHRFLNVFNVLKLITNYINFIFLSMSHLIISWK